MQLHPLIEGILARRAESRQGGHLDHSTKSPGERTYCQPHGLMQGQMCAHQRRDLERSALSLKARGLTPIIAEIKPRVLGRAMTEEEVARYARTYADGGACAISVLTEPSYFQGSIKNLEAAIGAGLPVLRKDFIIDVQQVGEAYADLTLLIAALPIDLDEMISAVRSSGSEPLVEVHSEEELERALETDARIIGVNNRDLRTLEVDLARFERLAPRAREAGVFLIAESGVHTRSDAIRMVDAGADALLVGTSLMEDPSRLAELNGSLLPRAKKE